MDQIILTSELLEQSKIKARTKAPDSLEYVQNLYNNIHPDSDYNLVCALCILYIRAISNKGSNHKQALDILNKVFKNAKIESIRELIKAELFFYYGFLHQYLGNTIESFTGYKNAVNLYQSTKEILSISDELNLANALINIAGLYEINGFEEYNKEDVQKALKIYKKHKANFGIPTCYALQASYAANKKQFELADSLYKKAIGYYNDVDNKAGVAACFCNLADIYALKEDFTKSNSYLKKADILIKSIGNPFLHALHIKSLANHYFLKKDFKKAITQFRIALEFYEKGEYQVELQSIYNNLAEVYSITNQYKKAYIYLEKYVTIKKNAFKFEKVSALLNAK